MDSPLKDAITNEQLEQDFRNFIEDTVGRIEVGNEYSDPIIRVVSFCSDCGQLHDIDETMSALFDMSETTDPDVALGTLGGVGLMSGLMPFIAFLIVGGVGGSVSFDNLPEKFKEGGEEATYKRLAEMEAIDVIEMVKDTDGFQPEYRIMSAGMTLDFRGVETTVPFVKLENGTIEFGEYEVELNEDISDQVMMNGTVFDMLSSVFLGARVGAERMEKEQPGHLSEGLTKFNPHKASHTLSGLMAKRLHDRILKTDD